MATNLATKLSKSFIAEGEGFEPSRLLEPSALALRRIQPLCQPSVFAVAGAERRVRDSNSQDRLGHARFRDGCLTVRLSDVASPIDPVAADGPIPPNEFQYLGK